MAKEINLDDVALSAGVVAAWNEVAQRVTEALAQISAMRGGKTFAIPDERGQVNDDGTLTIFISVPDVIAEASLVVPTGEWAWRSQSHE